MSVRVAALLMLLTLAACAIGSNDRDEVSYRAGYVAASNGVYVREAMNGSTMTASKLCDAMVERTLRTGQSNNIVREDFVEGCMFAVATAME